MREIVLTDIHGCYEELMRLLESIRFGGDDLLVGASDCLDKGPYSAKVIKFLRQASESGYCKHIRGNHEIKFLKFIKKFYKNEQQAMQLKHSRQMLETLEKLDSKDIEWLESSAFYAKLSQIKGIVIHAGLEPDTKIDPDIGYHYLLDAGKLRPLFYCRYLKNHKMARLGQEDADCCFWTEEYDGRYGHVFYGHQPWEADSPRLTENTTGLDLGCVTGGRLAAAIIEEGKVEFASVPGAQYAASYGKKAED